MLRESHGNLPESSTQGTSRTTEVSTEAEQTGRHAADVREIAAALNTAVGDLRHSVIRVVRTSTTEVDRRRVVRHQVDLPCRLSVPGQAVSSAHVIDISEGGASLRGGPSLPLDTRGALHLDGVGFALPFNVRSREGSTLRVKFELDEATVMKFRPVVEKLADTRAA
jgi:methyl-accepting chemotaxis protein